MALIRSLAISISIFASNVYSQEPGVVILQKIGNSNDQATNTKKEFRCVVRTDPEEPVGFKKTEDFYICDIISRQGSTVALTIRSKRKNQILYKSQDCSLQRKEDMYREFMTDNVPLFEPTRKSNCILITNMNIKERTNVVRVLFYSFLLIILVMGTLYAAHRYRFNPWTKLRERWQTQQDWDRLPLDT